MCWVFRARKPTIDDVRTPSVWHCCSSSRNLRAHSRRLATITSTRVRHLRKSDTRRMHRIKIRAFVHNVSLCHHTHDPCKQQVQTPPHHDRGCKSPRSRMSTVQCTSNRAGRGSFAAHPQATHGTVRSASTQRKPHRCAHRWGLATFPAQPSKRSLLPSPRGLLLRKAPFRWTSGAGRGWTRRVPWSALVLSQPLSFMRAVMFPPCAMSTPTWQRHHLAINLSLLKCSWSTDPFDVRFVGSDPGQVDQHPHLHPSKEVERRSARDGQKH